MISTKGGTENTRCLNFVVSDQGIGIANEDKVRIFETFEKAKFNEEDSTRGSGLGLSIVKHSLEQMDSEIQMTSRLGRGSKFKFMLELEIAEDGIAIASPDIESVESKSDSHQVLQGAVLIVDDNDINRTVLSEMVSRLGYEPECVALGSEAVEAAKHKEYALILMDVNMPVMDGYEATRAIRSNAGKSRDSIILGVTALIPSDRDYSTESGMDAMLAKPLTADRLERAINLHLGQATASAPSDDIEQLMDPVIGKKLKAQSMVDAQTALKVLMDSTTSWKERKDAAHYAVGSTGVVGFLQLSSLLSDAEEAAKQSNQELMDVCVEELKKTLTN
jgi:CheY-like chemotaxis protein